MHEITDELMKMLHFWLRYIFYEVLRVHTCYLTISRLSNNLVNSTESFNSADVHGDRQFPASQCQDV